MDNANKIYPTENNSTLKYEGVLGDGRFGLVFKSVMCNPGIPIKAKALYLMLSSLINSQSGVAFPSRDFISEHMGFGWRAMGGSLRALVENGVISKHQKRTKRATFAHNEYVVRVDMENGFGIILQNILLDKSLSAEAKAVYGLVAAFCGNIDSCSINWDNMCYWLQIGSSTLLKYIRELRNKSILLAFNLKTSNLRTGVVTNFRIIYKECQINNKVIENGVTVSKAKEANKPPKAAIVPIKSQKTTEIKDSQNINNVAGNGVAVNGVSENGVTNNNSIYNNNNICNNNRASINKSSSEAVNNTYPQLKAMMTESFNYSLPNNIYIHENVLELTCLKFYLNNTNRLIELSPAYNSGKYCTPELGANRAIRLAQAMSLLYLEGKIDVIDLEELKGVYQNARETKISNYKSYIMAVIKKNRLEREQNKANEKLRQEKIDTMDRQIKGMNDSNLA